MRTGEQNVFRVATTVLVLCALVVGGGQVAVHAADEAMAAATVNYPPTCPDARPVNAQSTHDYGYNKTCSGPNMACVLVNVTCYLKAKLYGAGSASICYSGSDSHFFMPPDTGWWNPEENLVLTMTSWNPSACGTLEV